MGYYIETPPHRHGKADILIKNHGAIEMGVPAFNSGSRVTICVVQNPCFEACGIAHSEAEFQCFNDPRDRRTKRWLDMSRVEVARMHPEHAKVLGLEASSDVLLKTGVYDSRA